MREGGEREERGERTGSERGKREDRGVRVERMREDRREESGIPPENGGCLKEL